MVDRRSNVFCLLSLAPNRLFVSGMPSRESNFRSNGNQVLKNFAHMANWQRVMSFVLNESRLAVRKTVRDFFRQPNGESAIFYSMPKSHRHANVFDRESPRLRVNLCIDHYPFRRAAPRASLAFENRFKSRVVAQAGRVAWPQQQHL